MPKSRRGRHIPRSKKKASKALAAPAVLETAGVQATGPAPKDKAASKTRSPVAVQASNIAGELRRIGIVTGIIVVILVILAIIFT